MGVLRSGRAWLFLCGFLAAAHPHEAGVTVRRVARAEAVAPSGTTPPAKPAASHPLDPLTADELAIAIAALRSEGRANEASRFPLVTLHEPDKQAVQKHRPGSPLERRAFVSVYDPAASALAEAIVDLGTRKIVSWKPIPGAQPPVLVEEYEAAGRIVRADPRWQAAMRRRGIDDFQKVQLDSWAGGAARLPQRPGARLLRVLSYDRSHGGNGYGRPIEGVVALVDMTSRTVAEFVDRGPVPISRETTDIFQPESLGPPRTELKPLTVRQEAGPGFTVTGQEVRWQGWRFRFEMHAREGLVLRAVGYEESGKVRSILYRASLSEMLVPYGDPDEAWNWRSAFDQGEYGLGQFANVLRRGEEVPENAALFSATHASESGEPIVREDVVALYEQDSGILWRHLDYETMRTVTRRGRQLVVHYLFTVGNYDYGLKWIFHQDGTIEGQVELTGILLAKGVPDTECVACRQAPDDKGQIESQGVDRYGALVAKNVVAPNHQHFFCFRLDLEIEGSRNSVAELDVLPETDPSRNPAGNAFFVRQQRLRNETEGRRSANSATQRSWKVFQPNPGGELGHFASYLLEPGPMPGPFATADSAMRRRGRFIEHPLWVTAYRGEELYAAGSYPNQNFSGDGLPKWMDGEPLENADVVLWHVLGVTHTPRTEDWPVMPTARASFRLAPHHFFPRNPALNIPARTR